MRRGLLLTAVLPVAACSYDWAVAKGGPGADAGADVSVGVDAAPGTDAPSDMGVDAAPPNEAAPPADAPSEVASDCASLEAQLTASRALAIQCVPTSTSACSTTITDECGCPVVVGDGQSTKAMQYAALAAAYVQQSCPRPSWCGTCMTPNLHLCIAVDGGASYACYP